MRIDVARNEIEATRALLALALEELDDLHVLAYDRATLTRERVAGGDHDYALDTHGDTRARDAYRAFSDQITETCRSLAAAAHDMLRLLRYGASPVPRTPRTITALEHAEALEAKARRAARGEYTPVRRHPQPDTALAAKAEEREILRLQLEVAELAHALDEMTRERDHLRASRSKT